MPQITKKNIEKMTDDELICYYKQYRDIDCVGELYKRYTGLTFAICMKYLKSKEKTEEIVLEIFEDLIEKLLIHDIENFKNWLYSVAKNHCLLKIRSFKSEVDLEINENILGKTVDETDFLAQEFLMKENNLLKLDFCLNKLKEEHKICIELFYIKEKSYFEITKITGFSLNEVKSFIQNGKRNLKILMEKHE